MKKTGLSLALLALVLLAPVTAHARPLIGIGPRVGFVTEGSDLSLGAEVRIPVLPIGAQLRLDLRPSFDWIFYGFGSFFLLSGDAILALQLAGDVPVEPYAIAGIHIAHWSYDTGHFVGSDSVTNVGLNLGAGAKFLPAGAIQPFVELRASIESGSFVLFTAGVLFVI